MESNYSLAERIFIREAARTANRSFHQVESEAHRFWKVLPEHTRKQYFKQAQNELGGPAYNQHFQRSTIEQAHAKALHWNKRLEEHHINSIRQTDGLCLKICDLKLPLEKEKQNPSETEMYASIKDEEAQMYFDLYEDLRTESRLDTLRDQQTIDDLRARLSSVDDVKRKNKHSE